MYGYFFLNIPLFQIKCCTFVLSKLKKTDMPTGCTHNHIMSRCRSAENFFQNESRRNLMDCFKNHIYSISNQLKNVMVGKNYIPRNDTKTAKGKTGPWDLFFSAVIPKQVSVMVHSCVYLHCCVQANESTVEKAVKKNIEH